MGRCAREFVDFLELAGQRYWQMLPVCPTGYGNSPYQSPSSFAGNPYFVDLEELVEMGLLSKEECRKADAGTTAEQVDYAALYEKRIPLLHLAAQRFLEDPDEGFGQFCAANAEWLEEHALFTALKQYHGSAPWHQWKWAIRAREEQALVQFSAEHVGEIAAEKALQYLFYSQWSGLKDYANARGIFIIGDMPIYVAVDSVEVWARRDLFQLDENGMPTEVAGCPPDGFSADGQLWGNPLFDWDYMARDGYAWWLSRVDHLCGIYDVVRLDHFRGLDSYYAVPAGRTDARSGRWRQGPGRALVEAMGERPLLAEDLGFLTPSVRQLLEVSGYPGMKVLQFAFDRREGDESHLPHKYPEYCVAYSGTHDNDTVAGWLAGAPGQDSAYAKAYLRLGQDRPVWEALCALWATQARVTIVQMQDLLALGSESRMNTPGTTGNNWHWRIKGKGFTKKLAQEIRGKMELYGRLS